MEIIFGVHNSVTVPLPLAPALPRICPCPNCLQTCSPPRCTPGWGAAPSPAPSSVGVRARGAQHPQSSCTHREVAHVNWGGCVRARPRACARILAGGEGVHSFVSTCTLVRAIVCLHVCWHGCASGCICTSVQVFMHLCRICLLARVCARVCKPFARLSMHTRVHECVCACTRGCNRAWVDVGGCSQVQITSRGISCA